MLPECSRGPCRYDFDQAEWTAYLARLGAYACRVDLQFLRQVPYDHFSAFNSDYPWFDIDHAVISRARLTAKDIRHQVRYFDNVSLDFWHGHFDDLLQRGDKSYEVFSTMREELTWSFPPILMMNEYALRKPRVYGCPIHLIEGTHRVSYLCRMLELELVLPESSHEVVVVNPNRSLNRH